MFLSSAESLIKFFEAIQNFPTILTTAFAELYEAKSAAEAEILDAQHKINLIQSKRK